MMESCKYKKLNERPTLRELCEYVKLHNAEGFYREFCDGNRTCPKDVFPLCPVCKANKFTDFSGHRKKAWYALEYCVCKKCNTMFKILPTQNNYRGKLNDHYEKSPWVLNDDYL